ncbi:MAG: hypothetical protein QF789_09580 [Gammaproteobacteria bacterium]|jgi:hypothetical protein|nr:hypothetical protein [Chromatiales bacterium]MDP7153019.1 hypothetical protein [Gammaproteobacteria bacterium]MDP7661454.1 hypothetical protein [Gammaproteobacteria bacterium]HJP05677.1 hypothetical protein [Gammaproteobacteria bacterium]
MGTAIKRWLKYGLLCVLMVPVVVFLGGWLLAGPYEGNAGLFGLMFLIYGDALSADLSAWVLLMSPLLLVLIWRCTLWLSHDIKRRQSA